MYTGLPVGHIVGADAEGKSIGEHCGASKGCGQLCGHLHHHHELSRYTLHDALASIDFRTSPSVWTILWPCFTTKEQMRDYRRSSCSVHGPNGVDDSACRHQPLDPPESSCEYELHIC